MSAAFSTFPDSALPVASSNTAPRLLLASASPRRAQLLDAIGVPFTLAKNELEEPPPSPQDEAEPQRYVERLARDKATACDVRVFADEEVLLLAADTIVWHAGKILNKPRDVEEARAMLQTLRGQTHHVFTGVCLRKPRAKYLQDAGPNDEILVAHEKTAVHFRAVSDEWIARYVATGEPLDKAGAYAAQGLGALLIEKIEGDFWNVVGLPLVRLSQMMQQIGAPLESYWEKTA